jgi:hypothetical protein
MVAASATRAKTPPFAATWMASRAPPFSTTFPVRAAFSALRRRESAI